MTLFFSRREYRPDLQRFTNNLGDAMRHVRIAPRPEGGYAGGIVSQGDWLDAVEQQADGQGAVVYIHGFNTRQQDMLRRCDAIEAGLTQNGYDGAVVAFDWPSQGVVTAYDPDIEMARRAAPFLVPEGLRPLIARLAGQPVHLICHSMGCYLTLRALGATGDTPGLAPVKLDQVLFAAADVWAERLRSGADAALVLAHRSNRLTHYYSTADKVLALSGVIHGGRQRAGQIGLPAPTPAQSVDVYTTAQFRRHVPDHQQGDYSLSHNWLYGDAGFLRDAALTLRGVADADMPTRRNTNTGDRALLT